MSNEHVSKPSPDAFDDMHLVWKVIFVLFWGFMLLFWGAVFFGGP